MTKQHSTAALGTLILLQGVMLFALFTKTAPHPPEVIPLGGMAPFLAFALSAAMAALVIGVQSTEGRVLGLVAAAAALVSYGPQKYFDAAFPLVWPAVITAQIAVLVLIVATFAPKGEAQ